MSITFRCIFCGIGSSLIFFFFFCRGAWNTSNRKYHVSVYFLRKVISLSSGEKLPCFQEKIPPLQIVQERSYPSVIPFEKTIFSGHWKKISYFRVFCLFLFFLFCFFLRNIIFHFPSGGKIIFSEKINIIFPNNTRKENMVFRSVSNACVGPFPRINMSFFLLLITGTYQCLRF